MKFPRRDRGNRVVYEREVTVTRSASGSPMTIRQNHYLFTGPRKALRA